MWNVVLKITCGVAWMSLSMWELWLREGARVATLTDVTARILPQVSSRLTDSASVTTHYCCVQVHNQIMTKSVTMSVTTSVTTS